jgi:hypothetical protein
LATESATIVQRLWNYCHVLRDDGVSYGDYKAARSALTYEREDFWATTSSKQLNFLQHVKTLLKIHGQAAAAGRAQAGV